MSSSTDCILMTGLAIDQAMGYWAKKVFLLVAVVLVLRMTLGVLPMIQPYGWSFCAAYFAYSQSHYDLLFNWKTYRV